MKPLKRTHLLYMQVQSIFKLLGSPGVFSNGLCLLELFLCSISANVTSGLCSGQLQDLNPCKGKGGQDTFVLQFCKIKKTHLE